MTAPGPFTDVAYLLLAPVTKGWASSGLASVLGAWPDSVGWVVANPALVKRGSDGSVLATVPAAFTAVVRFARPPDHLEDLRGLIGGGLDVHRSALVVGREWIAVEGGGEVLAAAFFRRRSGLSAGEMRRRWSEEHVAFARVVGHGYRQILVDPVATAKANQVLALDDPKLDGIALVYFADAATLTQTRASDAVAVEATADEAHFLDHERSSFVMLVPAPMGGHLS
jgi:EthD domain